MGQRAACSLDEDEDDSEDLDLVAALEVSRPPPPGSDDERGSLKRQGHRNGVGVGMAGKSCRGPGAGMTIDDGKGGRGGAW